MSARLRTWSLLLAAAAVLAGVWWRERPSRSLNVVIITLDTTRADRLPVYGFMDTSMPALEQLARAGVVFDQATSVSPLTLPAHTSLFTGLLPPGHGVRDNADEALAARHTTLAEVLHDRGFRTGAFVGSIVVGPERGLAQGFDRYSGVGSARPDRSPAEDPGQSPAGSRGRQRRADAVVTDAIRWLDDVAGSRFFLWAHLYDPHGPYDPPEPYRSTYSDPYIAEIAFADSQIGRLLDALEARRLMGRTIVIVAGDHGESLGDHGEQTHGVFIYESVLRVPLIIRSPAVSPGRIGGVVRLTDVMPTVLELLGIPAPRMDGVSLVDLLTGRLPTLDLEAYSESEYPRRLGWSPLRALRDGRFKLIDAPRPELYDLERDPFEERNVYAERQTMAAAMIQRLQVLARPHSPTGSQSSEKPAVLPSQLTADLAALGYVGSRPPRAHATSESLPDPKDCIGLYSAHQDRDGSIASRTAARCR
jgi:arylsulfatase A-like enzyme